jgi:CRISPR-associated protein Csm4
MNYQIWKLKFSGDVHFGDGGLNTCRYTFYADTLFSALCIEAVKRGQEQLDNLVQMAKEDMFRISDALPYIGENLYLPKPMMPIIIDQNGDSIQKKALKKLEYIPVQQYEQYLSGTMDIKTVSDDFAEQIGSSWMIEKAAITGQEQTMPYGIQVFRFSEDSGLYICIAYQDNHTLDVLADLMESLEYTGIGGKCSIGYGKFGLYYKKVPEELIKRLTSDSYQKYMTLSLSLPQDNELDTALTDADYQIVKRSGFIASASYAANLQKKNDLYVLSCGSVFCHRFKGSVYDVSNGGSHPVYRYAKPLFMGVM